jgi:hypothetical protein
MRSLVVFYSLTGNTRKLAEQAAQALEADLAEVRAPRYGHGFMAVLRATLDSVRHKTPAIEVAGPPPQTYDYVLVMAPVWAGQAAAPIQAWLAAQRGKLRRAGFVLTCNGSCRPQAFERMAELAGRQPESTLLLKAAEFRARTYLPPPFAALVASIRPAEEPTSGPVDLAATPPPGRRRPGGAGAMRPGALRP